MTAPFILISNLVPWYAKFIINNYESVIQIVIIFFRVNNMCGVISERLSKSYEAEQLKMVLKFEK